MFPFTRITPLQPFQFLPLQPNAIILPPPASHSIPTLLRLTLQSHNFYSFLHHSGLQRRTDQAEENLIRQVINNALKKTLIPVLEMMNDVVEESHERDEEREDREDKVEELILKLKKWSQVAVEATRMLDPSAAPATTRSEEVEAAEVATEGPFKPDDLSQMLADVEDATKKLVLYISKRNSNREQSQEAETLCRRDLLIEVLRNQLATLKAARAKEEKKTRMEAEAQGAAAVVKLNHVKKEFAAEKRKVESLRECQKEATAAAAEREKALANELRTIKSELESSSARLAAPAPPPSTTEIGRLRPELQSALAKITQLAPLQGQLKQAYARLAPANHRARELESTLSRTQSHISDVKRQLAIKTNEVNLIADETTRAAELVAKKEATVMQRSISELTSELEESQLTISRFESIITSLESASSAQTTDFNKLQTALATLQQSVEATMNDFPTPETLGRIAELELMLATTEEELCRQQDEKLQMLDQVEVALEEAEQREVCLKGQLARHQAEQNVCKGEFELRLAEVMSKMHEYEEAGKEEVEELRVVNSSLSTELVRLRTSLNHLSATRVTSDKASDFVPPPAFDLEQRQRVSNVLIAVLRSKLKEAQEELNDLRGALATERETNATFQTYTTLTPRLARKGPFGAIGSGSSVAQGAATIGLGITVEENVSLKVPTGMLSPPLTPDSSVVGSGWRG